jgi:endonuclease YncB( thermonuclease family)
MTFSTPRSCFITKVLDADTYRAEFEYRTVTLRIAGMDSPELAQPGGRWCKAIVTRLLLARVLLVTRTTLDPYHRIVADLHWFNGGRVAETLIAAGIGWHDPRFSPDRPNLTAAEHYARAHHLGLWRDPHAVPPWVWRRFLSRNPYSRRRRNHYRFRR